MPTLLDDLINLIEALKKHETFKPYLEHPSRTYRPPTEESDTLQVINAVESVEYKIAQGKYKDYQDVK